MSNLVKVEGEAYLLEDGVAGIEFYEEEFIVDSSVDSVGKARSLLRKAFITERLRKKLSGFNRVKTMQVVEFEPTDKKAKQSDLDKKLLQAIELSCVPENLELRKTDEAKVRALDTAITTAKARKEKKRKTVIDQGFID